MPLDRIDARLRATFSLIAACAFTCGWLLNPVPASGQQPSVRVHSIRVFASDPDAAAIFYEKAFGMFETRRYANRPTFKEIALNVGATPEAARRATTTTVIITTRPATFQPPVLPTLILEVEDVDRAVAIVETSGGTVQRQPTTNADGIRFAFVKDPDGNLVEVLKEPR